MKSKLIPFGQLMHQRLFWICNLFPKNLWDEDFDIDDVTVEDEIDDIIVDVKLKYNSRGNKTT